MALYVKLWTDILGDEKLMRAARKGAKHLHLLPWLIVFAKRVDDAGHLAINGETADPEDIAALVPGVKAKQVAACLDELRQLGILEDDGTGCPRFTNWMARTGPSKPSDTPEATRTRKRRSRSGHARDTSVTEEQSRGYAHSPEGEEELEQEIEQDSSPPRESRSVEIAPVHLGPTAGERSLALRLETDADRLALTAICAKVPTATAWVAEAAAALEGMHGPQLTPALLGEALRDYVANGALNAPSLQHFRKYLRRAAVPYMPARGAPSTAVDSALDDWARTSDAQERQRAH